LNSGGFMQVFNEVHNKHLNTSVGIVSVLIKDKNKNE